MDAMDSSPHGENDDSPVSNKVETLGHSKGDSLSSDDGDYVSCTNSVLPEEAENNSSVVMPSEAACNVKMSANMATKLSQMRISRESLNDSTENSCEDMIDEVNEHPHLGPEMQTSTPGRGPSQKPVLRQVFPCNSCLPFENNIVFCFVLSVWDNIVGPQTVHVWKRKSFPTQKTFDDVFEDVEVGEDLMNVRRGSIQTLLGMDIHRSTPPSGDGSWPRRHTGSRDDSRRYSSTSIDSELYSSTEIERKFPVKRIRKLNSTRLMSSPRSTKDDDTRPPSSVEAFCEDFGNDILMQSLSAIKDTPKNSKINSHFLQSESFPDEEILPEPEEHPEPLTNSAKNTNDSEGESDEQGKK